MDKLSKTLEQAKITAHSVVDALFLEGRRFPEDLACDQVITSQQGLKTLWHIFYKSAALLGGQIDRNWALPALIQIIGEIYYGQHENTHAKEWIGPAAKASLPFVWRNDSEAQAGDRDIALLKQLILQCHVMEQLASLHVGFDFMPEQAVEYRRGQLLHSQKNIPFILAANKAMRGKGTRMRVSNENTKLICNLLEFKKAIEAVLLLGTQPADIPLLRDTFYAYVPSLPKNFWRALWTRAFMMHHAIILTSATERNLESILEDVIIFPEHAIPVAEELTSQKNIESMFWQRPWLEKQMGDAAASMMNIAVRRPIMRIHGRGVFATSLALLGDSMNDFVESQIFRLPGREMGIELPDSVRKGAFTDKFEQEVIDALKGMGFIAGQVKEGSGYWDCGNGNEPLLGNPESKCPREIDVLAYHEKSGLALLIECKVLTDVHGKARYKTLHDELSSTDAAEYRFKLNDNAKWLLGSSFMDLCKGRVIKKVLLTDIPFPVFEDGTPDILLTDFDALCQLLRNAPLF